MKGKLDELLKGWAERRAADKAHLDRLSERIIAGASGRRFIGLEEPRRQARVPFTALRGVAWFALGAAAALLLVVGLGRLNGLGAPASGDDGAAGFARISAAELETKARLLEEVESLFPGQLKWIVEQDRRMDLCVQPAPTGQTEQTLPVVVRLVLVSKGADEAGWRKAWASDVVTRSEEVVRVSSDSSGEFQFWAYVLPDQTVAVDTCMELVAPVRTSSRYSGLVRLGVPEEVLYLRTEQAEYRVFQTIGSLPVGKGEST